VSTSAIPVTLRKTASLERALGHNANLARARRSALVRITSAAANASSLPELREALQREARALDALERELTRQDKAAMDAIERRRFPDETD
jgi:hypothetical protein